MLPAFPGWAYEAHPSHDHHSWLESGGGRLRLKKEEAPNSFLGKALIRIEKVRSEEWLSPLAPLAGRGLGDEWQELR